METGQLRELKPQLGYFAFVTWSPDGRTLLTRGRDVKGRNPGLYRIDVQTGDATLVTGSNADTVQWAPDGKHLYLVRGPSIVERDLASETEREIAKIAIPGARAVAFSPDGRSVALELRDTGAVFVMTMDGAVRELTRFAAPDELLARTHWTSDGRALAVATRRDSDGESGLLWIVDVVTGRRRKLEVNTDNWKIGDGFSFDRSGTQLAFVANAGQSGLEIRALENFLPTSQR
jgi:Tol biopolymer transport system component